MNARCSASTARTISVSRPCRDPKWWMSIRWLVPTAAAMSRRERSPMPLAWKSATTAASRSCLGHGGEVYHPVHRVPVGTVSTDLLPGAHPDAAPPSPPSASSMPPPPSCTTCLADYRTHHRPEGFLPPAFSDPQVLKGGVGEGNGGALGRGRRRPPDDHGDHHGARPGPYHPGDGRRARDHVHRGSDRGRRARALRDRDRRARRPRDSSPALFAPRMLAPLYADELQRLGEYARTHGPLAD